MTNNTLLRQIFDEVAPLYNEARPDYPDELFSALIDITGLSAGARLLEIGLGTGQATKPLAQKGFQITAVELGDSLAGIARHELRDYQNVQIFNVSFEEAALASQSFDLVYAATSFHWIEPSLKYLKTHSILKDNGHLAIIGTNHISDEDGDKFFIDSQPIYERYGYTDKHQKPGLLKNNELKPDEVDEHFFKSVHFQLFPIVITYSASNFVKLLNTFSNHLASDGKIQRAFYGEIENLINEQFGGKISKHFSMSLTIAKKI
jgi:ubiquinone/menaquinone biosynthesis C-methylase UbiE